MYITDLCRKREIGANCLLFELGPYRLLVDAGLHPKYAGLEAMPDLSKIPADSLDLILLTHCHLDHVGSLPLIAERCPSAQILMTVPSQLLVGRILVNSYNVMKRQKEELKIAEYPLYGATAIGSLEKRAIGMPYGRTRVFENRGQKLEITFHASGHVPGAAGVSLKCGKESIFMTGDVLFADQLTIPGARFPNEPCDILILETTRGASERLPGKSRKEEAKKLLDAIQDTIEGGGSCLIPAFAFGRMQEIIALLYQAKKNGELPEAPIFCSGLGMALVEYFDHIARRTGLVNFREQMIKDLKIRTIKAPLTPGKNPKKPGIYILSSGMLVENTPSHSTAAALAGDPRNAILFVGYCDPDTPGGALQATLPEDIFYFKSLDYACPLKARVERFDLSGHADREELINCVHQMDPRTVVLTHGDPAARDWFLERLAEQFPKKKVIDPTVGERILL